MLTREIFVEERSLLNAQKTAIRDLINDMVKEDLTGTVKLIKDVKNMRLEIAELDGNLESIPSQLKEPQYKKLIGKITELAVVMPQKGRIALAYMTPEVKGKVKNIADYILSQPGFKVQIDDYKLKARGLAEHYTRDKKKLEEAENIAYSDVKDRVCQVILKAADESNRENVFIIDADKAKDAIELIKNMNKKIEGDANTVEKTVKAMSSILFTAGLDKEEVYEIVDKWNNNSGSNIENDKINRIIDREEESFKEEKSWGREKIKTV